MTIDAEVLEPEVIPPNRNEPKAAEATGPGGIHPIVAGLIIDLLRYVTFGPVGLIAGAVVGFLAASSNRVPLATAVIIAVATGAYCALPPMGVIPVATVVGVVISLSRK